MEPCGAPAEHLRRSDAFGGLRAADVIKATVSVVASHPLSFSFGLNLWS